MPFLERSQLRRPSEETIALAKRILQLKSEGKNKSEIFKILGGEIREKYGCQIANSKITTQLKLASMLIKDGKLNIDSGTDRSGRQELKRGQHGKRPDHGLGENSTERIISPIDQYRKMRRDRNAAKLAAKQKRSK